jgi:hypothetical protein
MGGPPFVEIEGLGSTKGATEGRPYKSFYVVLSPEECFRPAEGD